MSTGQVPRPPVERSLVVLNGRVADLGGDSELPEAVAITGGRIAGVGSASEMLDIAGHDVEVLDAAGGTILPAFTDSHTHFKRAATYMALFLDFDTVQPDSIGDVLDAVRERSVTTPPGGWIQGDSLNPVTLEEGRFPTRSELDSVSPRHPVVLRAVGRHVVAANSLALEKAGIDHATPDPPGGHIERDEAGAPTGILHEEAKLRLDADRADTVIPPPTTAERLAALAEGVRLLSSLGIATIHEIPRTAEQIGDWLLLRESRGLDVRIRFYVRGVAAQTKLEYLTGLGLRAGFGDEWVRLSGVKVSLDGSVSHRNAMVYDPYPGTDSLGLERVTAQTLEETLRLAHDGGLPVAVHAIGQRAVDAALDGFATLAAEGRDVGALRHRIEHAFLPPRDGQLQRMKDLGLLLSTQPGFLMKSGDQWSSIFEDQELRGVMPLASALRLGVGLMINSDFPNSPLDPFVAIKAAVARRTLSGRVMEANEAISVHTAIQAMTHMPAYATFEEHVRGRVRVGHQADLVVLDRDPTLVDAEELDQVRVNHTIVGGRMVFSRAVA